MGYGWLLYVEDAESDRLLMTFAIQNAAPSLRLQLVPDGETAIAYLAGVGTYADRKSNPLPHLVLLDLKLPGKSGHDVLRWIRGQPAFEFLPVAILSSSPQPEDIATGYEEGANWYLIKPPTLARLIELGRILEGCQAQTPGNFDRLKSLPECKRPPASN